MYHNLATTGSSDDVDNLASAFSRLSLHDHQDVGRLELMPDDVLYQLFLSMKKAESISSILTTVRLSHVCAQWRDVIIHAPLLWTYVTMHWTQRGLDHSKVMEAFLHRSKGFSLSFHLLAPFRGRNYESLIHQLATLLHPHAHRLHTVNIMVDSNDFWRTPIRRLLPASMPLLRRLHLTFPNSRRCTLSFKEPRSLEEVSLFEGCLVAPGPGLSSRPFLDRDICTSHLTTISLKYCDIGPILLLPILDSAQSTLLHLEIYNDWETRAIPVDQLPIVTLPNLVSLSIGYRCPFVMSILLGQLYLPQLRSLSVHDFGVCPEPTTPTSSPRKPSLSGLTLNNDAHILLEQDPFTTVTHLTLRGVSCPDTPIEDMMESMQCLFEGLESLAIIRCDPKFVDGLFDVTLNSELSDLKDLTELLVTINDYPFFMEYLRLRAVRGLPRFKILCVNPRMALLRHFYKDYAESMYVRGHKHQELRSTP